ncbi:MAG: ParA family protein [Arcanobacterium sp.]|nr:ParA family protein [Arcanobacterium sp.]
MMIISVCNQKGGVGKTTVATNIACRLANNGNKRVLLVDCDPQGNATTTVGFVVDKNIFTLNDVLAAIATGAPSSVSTQAVTKISAWNIDLLPSDRLLASRENDVSLGRESRLKVALDYLANSYDYIVIDCPPSLGMLTTNALVASNKALIVTQAREASFDGVAEMVSTIAQVRAHYNKNLVLSGIVTNSYRSDRVDRRAWFEALEQHYGDYLFTYSIPERETIALRASQHCPIGYIDEATEKAFATVVESLKAGRDE